MSTKFANWHFNSLAHKIPCLSATARPPLGSSHLRKLAGVAARVVSRSRKHISISEKKPCKIACLSVLPTLAAAAASTHPHGSIIREHTRARQPLGASRFALPSPGSSLDEGRTTQVEVPFWPLLTPFSRRVLTGLLGNQSRRKPSTQKQQDETAAGGPSRRRCHADCAVRARLPGAHTTHDVKFLDLK